jgi:hypothetical protein
MSPERIYLYKVADLPAEFEQIHSLNYRTFVEEIPQHQRNSQRRRVDPFHEENTYLICKCEDQLVGMVAVRAQRPFSLDAKLPDLEESCPPDRPMCEVRLWAIEPDFREAVVMMGMRNQLWDYCRSQGYALALISGTLRQARLYRHLGFVPFGPQVGTPEAPFQPLYFRFEDHV